jgi:sigma-E factor negative regulatory protein RseB
VGRGAGPDGSEFEHLVYSDGLASFSIYVEEGLQGYGGGRLESIGPVHVFTGMTDGRQITVVGEVPQATVEFVGRALRRAPGPRRR